MTTLTHDPSLPHLPLPTLEGSRDFALGLIAPLVAPPILEASRRALDELVRPGGDGEKLQAALAEHQAFLPGNSSWLRPFWDDMYTAWRDRLPVHMNYVFCLDTERWGGERALPSLLRALAVLFRRIGLGTLEAQATHGGFFAMEQSQRCVYTRLPLSGNDSLRPMPLGGPQHIAVTRRGHWFILPLCEDDGSLASEGSLLWALADIRRAADALPPAVPIAAFTAARREEAAAARAALMASPLNRQNLTAIERAVLVLCLDEKGGTDTEQCRGLLCGDAAERWYDKSLQLVATDGNGLGANFEHGGCDAAIWLYLLELADAMITESGSNPVGADTPGLEDFAAVSRQLCWQVEEKDVARLEGLRREFAELAAKVSLHAAGFPEYSRAAVKKLGTSPDAFIQVAFQVAQYRMFKQLRSCYEAVAVRTFAQGRTEVCRSCTAEALAFAKALAGGAEKERLRELYRLAERAHLARLARAQEAMGAERHLFGLQYMYTMRGRELGLERPPAIFDDPGWLTLKRDSLSTSGIGAPFIRYFGFGPVVEDGLGLGYAPSAAFTNLLVTGYRGKSPDAAAFAAAFARAAAEMAALLDWNDNKENAHE